MRTRKNYTTRKAPARKRRRRSTRYVPKSARATIQIKAGRIVMVLPRRLKSLNKRGGWRGEYSERMAWQKLLAEADVTDDGSLKRPVIGRMRLDVIRMAPSKRYLLDVTNLGASVKRLEDSLVEAGYLLNDDLKSVDGPFMSQAIATDKFYWTIVTLTEAPDYVDRIARVDPRSFTARNRLHTARHAAYRFQHAYYVDLVHVGRSRMQREPGDSFSATARGHLDQRRSDHGCLLLE